MVLYRVLRDGTRRPVSPLAPGQPARAEIVDYGEQLVLVAADNDLGCYDRGTVLARITLDDRGGPVVLVEAAAEFLTQEPE